MKRILLIALSLVMAAMIAGCSADAQAPSGSEEASPTRDTGEFYGTWTKSDWDSASAEEKELAVIYLVSEAVASQGADEEVVQSTVDDAEESLTQDQYADIEDAITSYFDKAGDKGNLQDSLNDVMGTISKYVPIG